MAAPTGITQHLGPQDTCAGRPTLRVFMLAQFEEDRDYTAAELYAASDRGGYQRRPARRALVALAEEGVLERVGYGGWRRA